MPSDINSDSIFGFEAFFVFSIAILSFSLNFYLFPISNSCEYLPSAELFSSSFRFSGFCQALRAIID